MSYDVSLTTPVELGREHELFEVGYYTGNVSRMWTEALGHPLSKMHGRVAKLEVDALEEAICRMRIEPDLYRAMNPPNGWGSYEG
ncbi:MAG: hypothetical protein JWL97_3814, partial [Gemmatimonadales bacterium]|nr:hypothetical protein [Gemmatimonadales bacterium]